MGNVRVSFAKNSAGSTEVIEINDYYPFGMSHLGADNLSGFGQGAYQNYKYNRKELQETGFLDYGWRQYMPELGRWFGMDQLSESYVSHSPYAYVMNNPAMYNDVDGRLTEFKMAEENEGLEFSKGLNNMLTTGSGKSTDAWNSLNNLGNSSNEGGMYSSYNGDGVTFTGSFAQMMFNYLLQNTTATGILNIKGFHFVTESKTPNIYKHTLNAFMHGKPQILHYDSDVSRKAQRRREALKGQTRLPGMSLDEYPFASTFEGGKDALVANVPVREQSIQGAHLGGFGGLYNTLKSGDAFMVLPVPSDREPEDVKQEVMQRFPQPVQSPIGRPLDFANPAVPRNLWPALGVVAVGAFMYHFGWRVAL